LYLYHIHKMILVHKLIFTNHIVKLKDVVPSISGRTNSEHPVLS